MKLNLNHEQRLNLHVILGIQAAPLRDIKPLWELQDRLALTEAEKTAIELVVDIKEGQERESWNPKLSLPPKEFSFSEVDVARIRLALESFQGLSVSTTRRWLAPILGAILADQKR